jgi:phosphosulfolactate phosphohydrolase-like enzyme
MAFPETPKLPVIPTPSSALTLPLSCVEPVTIKKSLTLTPVLTSKPLFGERRTSTEPDFNLSISPIASAEMLNSCEPSPLKKDADTEPLIVTEPNGTSILDVIAKV